MARSNSGQLEDLVAKWEPNLREAFLKAIQGIVDRTKVKQLADLIRAGNITEAVESVGLNPLDFRDLTNAITAAFNDGGTTVENNIPATRNQVMAGVSSAVQTSLISFRFDIRNLTAEEWTRNRSSELVQGIVEDQRNMIRQVLTEGLISGQNPVNTALDLVGRINKVTGRREGGLIGLTSQQEQWQRNYADELARAHLFKGDPANFDALVRGLRDKRFDATIIRAINSGKAIPEDVQQKILVAYRNSSLKYRADVISRNETMRAIGASQTEAWQQAIDRGHVQTHQIKRFWVTAGDERVRHTHRMIPGMNEEGVGWDQPFQTPTGESMHAPHDVDVLCRCRERIQVDYFQKRIGWQSPT